MKKESVISADDKQAERLTLSIEQAAWRLSVSPSFLRLEITRGRLRPVRLGRRVLIGESEIQRYLAAHASAGEDANADGSGEEEHGGEK
jgi:excisionase family DNA binding protein